MRRRLALAAFLGLAVCGPARADWQVHRDGTRASRALLERAEQALRDQPDDEALARRLLRLAGRSGREAVVARFRARAEGRSSYPPLAAYAQLLLAAGDGPGAAVAFAAALRAAPDAVAARLGRARALALAGAVSDALAAYDEALQGEQRPQARRHLIEAELALLAPAAENSSGQESALGRAVTLRRALCEIDPDRDGCASKLADALERAGQPGEAARMLEARLVPGRPAEKPALALRAARLRLDAGTLPDATRAAALAGELARQLPPRDEDRRREAWTVALAAARHLGTLAELGTTLAGLGDRAGAAEWDVLGQLRDELGDLEGALAATRVAVERSPRDAEIAGRLVALLDRLGRDEEATRASEELARRIPSNPKLAVDLVDRLMRRDQRAEASAAFDRTVAHFVRDRGALLELAAVASRWGDDRRALEVWQRLHRLAPADEVGIVGLGEAQFQSGHKDDARRTWTALRGGRPSAEGHVRFAEVLLEHDFIVDATAEARRAQALDPQSPAPHRLLAQIFERDRKIDDAISEWNVVLALASRTAAPAAGGADDRPAREREAHLRLLGLFAKQGRGRLEAQIRKLSEEARDRPDDGEATLFLAQAEERAGDTAGAVATLRALVARLRAGAGARANAELADESAFALVRLLKRSGQIDEAMQRLEEIATGAPGRAREAHLQIADLALSRYDTPKALDHAGRAAAEADGPTLARIAELEARAGAEARAANSYRAALAGGAGPGAALALARLLERSGDATAAAAALDELFRMPDDDVTITEAGRLAIDLAETTGTLPALEERLAERLLTRDTPARRRILVALLRRVVPPLYREAAGDEVRARLAPLALHVLLELVTDREQPPDRAAIELVGMLGNGDAAPALARVALPPMPATVGPPARAGRGSGRTHLAQRAPEPKLGPDARLAAIIGQRAPEPKIGADTRFAAVVALARLGDPRGRPALERLAATADQSLRVGAVWGLGRISSERAGPILVAALEDRHPEVAAAACLGLGRRGDDAAVAALARVATDRRQPPSVRRAAVVALGRAGGRRTTRVLFQLLDGGDEELSRAAALALAWARDPGAVPGLLSRALLPRSFALADAGAPVTALEAIRVAAPPPDEARSVSASRLDLDAALGALLAPTGHGDLTPLLRAHARAIQEVLGGALADPGDARREALAALDGRGDGLGLGALADGDGGDDASAPDAALAIREIVEPLADRVALLLDAPDPETRAAALRVLVRLDDERVTPARVAGAAGGASPLEVEAARFAVARAARLRPGAAPGFALVLAPALADDSWRRRLATVEVLDALGRAGLPALDRARSDRNAIVREAALQAIARHAIDLPVAPSRMP